MSDLATERLIRGLTADLAPVSRLWPPALRAAAWVAAVAGVAAVLAWVGHPGAMMARLSAASDMWLAALGSTATLVLAAIATFELCLPDRKVGWALLPVPGLALWIGASGLGCLRSWSIPGVHPASATESTDCIGFIVALSLPLSIAIVLMIRRACPLRPNLTAAMGGLASASASATLLDFVHPYDASASDLAVHLLAVILVVTANNVVGGRLLGVPGSDADLLSKKR